ncbi:MAG: MerC family mercury resistance protein [Bryobacteraceae bacterium]
MTNATVKQTIGALPGIGVSLLPKLMCPACWPAYAGIVSALGLGFLISTKYLLPLTAGFLAISAMALGFHASHRRGYGPFGLGIVAAAVILTGKFYFDSTQAAYAGVGLLIAASVWNSWPRRAATAPFCSACVPAEAGFTHRNVQGEEIHEKQN